jgi:hypothetical protein
MNREEMKSMMSDLCEDGQVTFDSMTNGEVADLRSVMEELEPSENQALGMFMNLLQPKCPRRESERLERLTLAIIQGGAMPAALAEGMPCDVVRIAKNVARDLDLASRGEKTMTEAEEEKAALDKTASEIVSSTIPSDGWRSPTRRKNRGGNTVV